jgi:hypothetical protein
MGGLSPEATLLLIQQLIATGELQGTITQSKSTKELILRFTPTAHNTSISSTTETEVHARLAAEVQRVKELADLVALADAKLMVSKDYISSMKSMKMDEVAESDGARRWRRRHAAKQKSARGNG